MIKVNKALKGCNNQDSRHRRGNKHDTKQQGTKGAIHAGPRKGALQDYKASRIISPFQGYGHTHLFIYPALAGWANCDGLSGFGRIEMNDSVPLCATSCRRVSVV